MRYATCTLSTPATGSNAIPIDTSWCETPPQPSSTSEIPLSAFISESYFLQCTPIMKNHTVMVTVKEEKWEREVLAIMRSKVKTEQSAEDRTTKKHPPPPVTTPPPKPANNVIKTSKMPTFKYESKAAAPDVIQHIYKSILDTEVPHLTISDLLTISPELQKEAVEKCHTHRVPVSTTALFTNTFSSHLPIPVQIKHSTPLREIYVTLNGVYSELALLDKGLEIVIIQEEVWKKINTPINQDIHMHMQTANRGSQEMIGLLGDVGDRHRWHQDLGPCIHCARCTLLLAFRTTLAEAHSSFQIGRCRAGNLNCFTCSITPTNKLG
ncbi:hypothetical protein BDR05DRAFT_948574 [Suillus weaverae]|nr:hypothetical protein BDR05DRAFT_948574 [Suillus weaverae]